MVTVGFIRGVELALIIESKAWTMEGVSHWRRLSCPEESQRDQVNGSDRQCECRTHSHRHRMKGSCSPHTSCCVWKLCKHNLEYRAEGIVRRWGEHRRTRRRRVRMSVHVTSRARTSRGTVPDRYARHSITLAFVEIGEWEATYLCLSFGAWNASLADPFSRTPRATGPIVHGRLHRICSVRARDCRRRIRLVLGTRHLTDDVAAVRRGVVIDCGMRWSVDVCCGRQEERVDRGN